MKNTIAILFAALISFLTISTKGEKVTVQPVAPNQTLINDVKLAENKIKNLEGRIKEELMFQHYAIDSLSNNQ